MRRRKSKLRNNYFFYYTMIFAILSLLVFMYFIISGKSLIWSGNAQDGISQHYNTLVYVGEYYRSIITEFLHTGKLIFPSYNFSLGFGSDILMSLQQGGFTDPLNYLSILVPSKYSEYLFNFLVVLRMYLAGIAFLMYCHRMHKKRSFSTLGAIIYVFTSYTLFFGTRHPYFIMPMVYLPLILIGIEKIFSKEKPFFFLFTIFFAAYTNFYFFFMLSIVMAFYIVIRLRDLFKVNYLKNLIHYLKRLIVYYITGVLLASVSFCQAIYYILSSSRLSVKTVFDFLYDINYYKQLPYSFVSSIGLEASTVLGVSFLALLSLVLIMIKKNKYQAIKEGFIVGFIMLLFPVFGSIMNGFSYPTNRWSWAFCFIIAYIFVVSAPYFFSLTSKEILVMAVFGVVYTLGCIFINVNRNENNLGICLLLVITLLVILFANYMKKSNRGINLSERFQILILLISICAGVIYNSYYMFSPRETKHLSEYIDSGMALKTLIDTPAKKIKSFNNTEYYRYDENIRDENRVKNSALLNKVNGTSYFWSVDNPYTTQFMDELYLTNSKYSFDYGGVDERAPLEALFNVKYYAVNKDDIKLLPYGFNKSASSYKFGYGVYENSYCLPFGYTYSSVLSKKEYEKLNPVEKQEALLQSMVLDEELTERRNELNITSSSLPYKMSTDKGIKIKGDTFITTKPNQKITFEYEGLQGSETYIIIDNLQFEGINPIEQYKESNWNKIDKLDRIFIEQKYENWEEPESALITASAQNIKKNFYYRTPEYKYYANRHSLSFNMGYSENGTKKVTLNLPKIGEYKLSGIKIIAQPMEQVSTYINELGKEHLVDVSIKNDTISGNINIEKSKYLCFSIPYSVGWEIYVDGKKETIKRANVMMMAVKLNKGVHSIRLTYTNPIKKFSYIATIAGILLLLIELFFYFTLNRQRRRS